MSGRIPMADGFSLALLALSVVLVFAQAVINNANKISLIPLT